MFLFVNALALTLGAPRFLREVAALRILRSLAVSGVFGVNLLAIGFVCADRLAHPPAAPIPVMARANQLAPSTTGSIAGTPPVAALPKVASLPKATDGFDTERLNALLRGDPLSGPTRR